MKGICKLYNVEAELRESHIFPKFTVEYMKRTGSRFLRNPNNPNLRKQDGLKYYLLSAKAEQQFGDREKWFSQKVFYPHQQDKLWLLEYDENLYYFALSFLWRVLIMELNFSSVNVKSHWFYEDLIQVEEEWRAFLNSYQYPNTFNRVYIQLTDKIKDHDLPFGGVEYYFTRHMDATIVYNHNRTFLAVYGKFLKFIFWGIIKGGDEVKLQELKVNPIKGVIKFPQVADEFQLSNFYYNRIMQIENLPKASKQQQDLILKEILKDKEGFLNSEAGKAIRKDIDISESRHYK